MRLSKFILEHVEEILEAWEEVARQLVPGKTMTVAELRNDAERMLRFVAEDIETEQSSQQEASKSLGKNSPNEQSRAAGDHGLARAVSNFSLSDLVGEFRALRASVSRLWLERSDATHENTVQLVRFNEAIDQLIAESVVCFSRQVERNSALFTASIGHDLRNPLNAVVMLAGGLSRSSELGESVRDKTRTIERSAKRIAGMIQELQDFTSTRLGSALTYTRAPVDVAYLCREVVGEIKAANPSCDIRLVEARDMIAIVDRPRVAQAISNVIGNACEHGAQGRPINVRVTLDDDAVVLHIHNEGEPIPPEHLLEIFEPLKTRSRSGQGRDGHLGLGLYIARRIVEGHNGMLTVSSTDDRGTTFTMRLPRRGEPLVAN